MRNQWLIGAGLLALLGAGYNLVHTDEKAGISGVLSKSLKSQAPAVDSQKVELELAQKKEQEQKALARVHKLEQERDELEQKLKDQIAAQTAKETQNTGADASASSVRVLLVPEKETTIASMLSARIIALNGSLGQTFRAGETLVSFDCEEALARVEMSKAELSGAIDQHEAKVKMQGLDQASDVEVSLAAATANKAKAQLALNQAQVSQCRIYAPWGGRVSKLNVKPQMTVTPGQPLMELIKDGPLKLRLNVPSKLLASIKSGSKFNVRIDETSQSYQASVSAINSRVDPVSQTVEIEARLTKSYSELLAGMSGEADLASFQ